MGVGHAMGRSWAGHGQEMCAEQVMGRSWAGGGCRAGHGQVMGKRWVQSRCLGFQVGSCNSSDLTLHLILAWPKLSAVGFAKQIHAVLSKASGSH